MAETSRALSQGRKHHQQGDLSQAERCYRQALQESPADAEALYLLGNVCQVRGKLEEALAHYGQVLQLRPTFAQGHNSLGIVLARLGRTAEAVAAFQEAVGLDPTFATAHSNLGNALKEQGQREEALAHYRQAVRLQPEFAEAHNNLGSLLSDLGCCSEAAASCRQALRLKPDFAQAHNNLGLALARQGQHAEAARSYRHALQFQPDYPEAHNNLGATLVEQRQFAEAVRCFHHAMQIRPGYTVAQTNLARVLVEQNQLDEAVALLRQIVQREPEDAAARAQLGVALMWQGNDDEALEACRRAVLLRPAEVGTHTSLGLVQVQQGRFEEGLASYARALQLAPDDAIVHKNRALAWLLLGEFEKGWPEYEWRWRCNDLPAHPFLQPPWDGSPLEGRTILLHAEQGLGDTLQFIRYAPLVKERGGRVVVVCQPKLLGLLASCPGIDRLVPQGAPLPPLDVQAPLLSLPRIFATTLATLPAAVPYLQAEAALVEQWRKELSSLRTFKVGIAWQGSTTYRADRQRSLPLARFAPLAAVPGVELLSLQKGYGSEQRRQVAFPVTDLGSRLDETTGPFRDTAAVLGNLDLVITSDTALPHLAGALGVPVWVALPFVADWRWLLGREDSPWYPTMRLFRQTRPGDWEGVFARMATALRARLGVPPALGRITIDVSPAELLDRIARLEVERERSVDASRRRDLCRELTALTKARAHSLPEAPALTVLAAELKAVNAALREAEDQFRHSERHQGDGTRVLELARNLCHLNDRRAALMRQIDERFGRGLVAEVSGPANGPALPS